MASSSHHLLNLLFFVSIFFTSINDSFARPPTNICPHFDCGKGDVIRYPLWHQSQSPEHCGYQGLSLSCQGQNPVIILNNNFYKIRSINYSENSLVVSYADQIQNPNCPKIPSNLTAKLTSPVFNYTSGNKLLTFFYNCTLYPPSQQDITCFQSGTKRSFVFSAGAVPEFDWHANCESTATIPVGGAAAFDDGELLISIFARALTEGFKLTWRTTDGACQACEAADSDGFCGYSTNGTDGGQNFFCICPEGRRSISCYGDGKLFHISNLLI